MTSFGDIPSDTDIALTADAIPAGYIIAWPSATPPSGGWLLCDGAQVSSTTYPILSALLNGVYDTTAGLSAPAAGMFRTPPLVKSGVTDSATLGRTPIGILSGSDSVGSSGSAWGHGHGIGTLSLPAHTHNSYGPDGQMRATHSHNWSPGVNSHTHTTSHYTGAVEGSKASTSFISGGGLSTVTSPISGGVSSAAAYIYGNSDNPSGWGLSGGLTDPQDGPFTGIYWYIKT